MVVEWWRDVEGRRRNSELRESSQRRGSRLREVSRAAKRHRTCREFKAPKREKMRRDQHRSSVYNWNRELDGWVEATYAYIAQKAIKIEGAMVRNE